MLIEGAADRVVFDAFIAQMLVPSLRPGQTVVLDNLNVHKSPKARQLIAEAGCQLRFLPTYSPDFNPIENLFAKYKTHLRRAEARTFDDLVTATGIAFSAITASDAQGCFRDAGYRLTGQPI